MASLGAQVRTGFRDEHFRSPSFGSSLVPARLSQREESFNKVMKAYATSKAEKLSREKILEHIHRANAEQVGACPFAAEEDILSVKILCQLLYDELDRVARAADQCYAQQFGQGFSAQSSSEKPRSLQDFTFNQDKEKYYLNKLKMLEAEVDTLKSQVSRKQLLLEKQLIKKSLADKDWQRLLDLVADSSTFTQDVATFIDSSLAGDKQRLRPNAFIEKKGESLSRSALQLGRRFEAAMGFLHASKRDAESEDSRDRTFESPDVKRFFLSSKKSSDTPTRKLVAESPPEHFLKTQPLNLRISKGAGSLDGRPTKPLVNYDALATDSNLYKLSADDSKRIEEHPDRLELSKLLAKHRHALRKKPTAELTLEANAVSIIERLAEERDAAVELREQLSKVHPLNVGARRGRASPTARHRESPALRERLATARIEGCTALARLCLGAQRCRAIAREACRNFCREEQRPASPRPCCRAG